jgi:hypothetical protein
MGAPPYRRWTDQRAMAGGAVLELSSSERLCFSCPLPKCLPESHGCPYALAERAIKLSQERVRRSRGRASGGGRG